jgi:hypothetical protein
METDLLAKSIDNLVSLCQELRSDTKALTSGLGDMKVQMAMLQTAVASIPTQTQEINRLTVHCALLQSNIDHLQEKAKQATETADATRRQWFAIAGSVILTIVQHFMK